MLQAQVDAPEASKTDALIARETRALVQNYKRQPIVLVRGEGSYVWDIEGRRYLDLIGGIATCVLGHCHPQVVAAAHRQLDLLWHVSNAFNSEPHVELAERLTGAATLPGARAFFCNSGAEANEGMVKLARRYQQVVRGRVGCGDIITFDGSFHGRTLAMLAATAQPKYQRGYAPLSGGFKYATFGDLGSVAALMTDETAAVMVEVIQGEGGVRLAPEGFIENLRALCSERGALLLIDEVQTGMGRTGKPFGFQHHGIVPDAFSVAKSLANGLPIGALVCSGETAVAFTAGSHGSTFGGNLVACAAGCAVFDIAMTEVMMREVTAKGEVFRQGAKALMKAHPGLVRGRGLLMGIEVGSRAPEVLARCRASGVLANLAGEHTIRFAPSFLTTPDELLSGLSILGRAL